MKLIHTLMVYLIIMNFVCPFGVFLKVKAKINTDGESPIECRVYFTKERGLIYIVKDNDATSENFPKYFYKPVKEEWFGYEEHSENANIIALLSGEKAYELKYELVSEFGFTKICDNKFNIEIYGKVTGETVNIY
jgi:hypothetical protein